MDRINKNHVRVRSHAGSMRVTIPSWKVKELGLEDNDLIDISDTKKVAESNEFK